MRISMDGDDEFLVGILAEILCKIEGKLFVSETTVRDLPPGAAIHIWYDEDKRGWWVRLDTGELDSGAIGSGAGYSGQGTRGSS